MAVIIKSLTDGRLTRSVPTLTYTPPAGRMAVIKNIRLGNPGSQAVTLKITSNSKTRDTSSGTGQLPFPVFRYLTHPDLSVSAFGFEVLGDEVTVGPDDTIALSASANADFKLDVVISGIERDA